MVAMADQWKVMYDLSNGAIFNDLERPTNPDFKVTPLFKKRYEIRYDSVYLTCSKKLTDSQLSLPHGTNKM